MHVIESKSYLCNYLYYASSNELTIEFIEMGVHSNSRPGGLVTCMQQKI